MARQQKVKTKTISEDGGVTLAHIRRLGLKDKTAYKTWCRERGLRATLKKGAEQRRHEVDLLAEEELAGKLARQRFESRNLKQAIEAIYHEDLDSVRAPALLAVQQAFHSLRHNRHAKATLLRLLLHVERHTDLLTEQLSTPYEQFGETYVVALTNLVRHLHRWLRPVEDWRPVTHNARRQYASLVRHLLAAYEVPAFMDAVWFQPDPQQQAWFIHIGQGENLRTLPLPIAYTKRMAHHFLTASREYTVLAALRRGQVLGLGGDERLAAALRETRLCREFQHEEFWITVVRFLIDNPMLDTVHVGPLIDYLHNQRFVGEEYFVEPGVIAHRPPPQPGLTMKGRDVNTLLRQVSRWHRQLSRAGGGDRRWPPSGILPLDWIEGRRESRNMRRWQITELCTSRALFAEGRSMHHCVGSYVMSCARRATSIWSLTVENEMGVHRQLTIEVRLGNKQIVQARGKYNQRPTDKERKVMARWADLAGLSIASYV